LDQHPDQITACERTELKTEPDWDQLPEDVPVSVRKLLRRCLEKNRKRRLHDIADARIEIEEALTSPAGETSEFIAPASTRSFRRHGLPFIAALILMAILAALVGWNLRLAPTLPVTRTVITLPDEETIPVNGEVPLALSPDGAYLVYAAKKRKDPSRLYLRPMNRLAAQVLPGTEGAYNLFSRRTVGGVPYCRGIEEGLDYGQCRADHLPYSYLWSQLGHG
jgi:hypothetical protein